MACQHIYRGTAVCEVRNHLRRDFLGKGAHALLADAVVAGHHEDCALPQPGPRVTGHAGYAHRELLEDAEASLGFRETVLPRLCRRGRPSVRLLDPGNRLFK